MASDLDKQRRNETYICRFIQGKPGALYDIGVGPKTEWKTIPALYPEMKVFGCEPNNEEYQRLLKEKFPGPLANVAIGRKEGFATLHLASNDPKVASLFPTGYANVEQKTKVWTLDRFDREMGKPDRIILWMDIEGSEQNALESGKRLLASGRVRWINLEERLPGKRVVPEWADPKAIQMLLEKYNFFRQTKYNCHITHQDAIYIHKGEK